MTNPIGGSFHDHAYQNFNINEDPDVVFNLYEKAKHLVKNLDKNSPVKKDLLHWYTTKLIPRFREAHNIENDADLRQDLEEFIDAMQKTLKTDQQS